MSKPPLVSAVGVDVGGQFRRCAIEREANDDLDAFSECLAEIGVFDDDYSGHAFDEVAPHDVYCDRLVMSLRRRAKALRCAAMTTCRPQPGSCLQSLTGGA